MQKYLKPQYAKLYQLGMLKSHTTHIGINQYGLAENERQCRNLAKLVDAMGYINAEFALSGNDRNAFNNVIEYVKNSELVTAKFAAFYHSLDDTNGVYKRMTKKMSLYTIYVPQDCGVNIQVDQGDVTLGFSTPLENGVAKRTSKYDRIKTQFISSVQGLTNERWKHQPYMEEVDQGTHALFLSSEWVNVRGVHVGIEKEVLDNPSVFQDWQRDMLSSQLEDRQRALAFVKITIKLGTYLENNQIVPCFQVNPDTYSEIERKYQSLSKFVKDKVISFAHWFQMFINRWCRTRTEMITARDTENSYESIGALASADGVRTTFEPNRVNAPYKNPYRMIGGWVEKAKRALKSSSFSIAGFAPEMQSKHTAGFLYEGIYKTLISLYSRMNDAKAEVIRSELQEQIWDCKDSLDSLKTLYGEFSDAIDFALDNHYDNIRALI